MSVEESSESQQRLQAPGPGSVRLGSSAGAPNTTRGRKRKVRDVRR